MRRLWHLDRQVWSRKGAVTRCLNTTVHSLWMLVWNVSREEPSDADLPAAPVTMTACVPLWRSTGLSWADVSELIAIIQAEMARGLGDSTSRECGWLAQAALNSLKADIAGDYLAAQGEEIERRRDDGVAAQHLAGRFLANASHEIRTPLTAVLGFSELLLEETYGTLNAEQRAAVGHIENSAQNLLEIVNNVLDLMQYRAGRLQLQYRRVAAAPLLENIHSILLPLSQRRKVRFTHEIPEDLGSIEADEGIVRHIVYHLLESALRATPQGGEVVLRAARGEGTLTIVAYDTALHFPPEAVDNMNDAYPILENSPARGYEGWEIGLPLVRRYVDLHGGTLSIDSSPDSGTTFLVKLPVQQPTHTRAAAPTIQANGDS